MPYEDRGHRFALVGDPIDFVVGGGALSEEPKKLSAFTVLLIFLTLWILFRSPKVPLSALATVGLAALWTLGLMGWAGWPQTEISQSLVPLILVVGVCDSMHFLSRYGDLRDATKTSTDRNAALLETAADVGAPCLLTSLTTAAGFASFVVSDLASFMRFGLAASVGIVDRIDHGDYHVGVAHQTKEGTPVLRIAPVLHDRRDLDQLHLGLAGLLVASGGLLLGLGGLSLGLGEVLDVGSECRDGAFLLGIIGFVRFVG